MKTKEEINGKIFIAQTTYYIYIDDPHYQLDIPLLTTSDKELFDIHREIESKQEQL